MRPWHGRPADRVAGRPAAPQDAGPAPRGACRDPAGSGGYEAAAAPGADALPQRRPSRSGRLALWATVAATGAALPLGSQRSAGPRLALVLAAAATFAIVLTVHARRPFLTVRAVLAGSLALLAVAVALPPQGSADLWSYAAYGRTVLRYHQSPYRTDPDDLGPDRIMARVGSSWREARSVYGPAFVVLAVGGSAVAGSSLLGNRLFFQGLAALAVAAALALLARRRCDPAALAFIGLNPAVAVAVVNGGHNDALVGLLVLAGALWAEDHRPTASGAALGLAALVKVVALLPLAAVAAATWGAAGTSADGERGSTGPGARRAGRRDRWEAVRIVGVGAGLVCGGYLLAGGTVAVSPLLASKAFHSRASVWTLLGGINPDWRSPVLCFAVVAAATGIVVARWSRAPAALLTGTVLVVYLLGAPYVLPWYVAWAIPVLGRHWRSPVAAVTGAAAVGLVVSYVGAPRLRSPTLHLLVHPFYAFAMPLLFAGGLAWLVFGRPAPGGAAGPSAPPAPPAAPGLGREVADRL